MRSSAARSDALNPYLTLGDLRRDLARGKEWPALDAALERLRLPARSADEHGYRVGGARPPSRTRGGERLLAHCCWRSSRQAARPCAGRDAQVAVAARPPAFRRATPRRSSTLWYDRAGSSGSARTSTTRRTVCRLVRSAGRRHGSRGADDPGRSPRPARHLAALRPGPARAHGLRGPDATRGGGAPPAAPAPVEVSAPPGFDAGADSRQGGMS